MTSELKFTFNGGITLREDFKSPSNVRYYAVLDGFITPATTPSSRDYIRIQNLAVPITEEKYKELKKELQDSDSKSPFLRFEGELETSVQSSCIN